MKKLLVAVILMAAIFGGTFAAWQYGVVDRAWNEASGLVAKLLGRGAPAETAASELADAGDAPQQSQTRQELLSAMAGPQQESASSLRPTTTAPVGTALRPPVAQTVPQLDADSPIDVAVHSSRTPVTPAPAASADFVAPGSVVAAPSVQSTPAHNQGDSRLPIQTRPSPQQQLQAQVMAASTPVAESAPAVQQQQSIARQTVPVSGPDAGPTPVLSDARAQIKVVDQLLASDPAEAMRRINDVLAMRLEPDDAAEAGYRKGYAARMLRDEATAEQTWRETADKYPALRGGRYSALALGDTFYHKYAGERPQTSFWDDISIMYSRALGKDDGAFLPPQVKAAVKQKLNRINDSILFGSGPTKLARYHKVESGELLGSIAGKYRVDYESIARINGIDPNRIRAGMDLKLVVGDVEVVVRKNSADPSKGPSVTWFVDGRWAREYPACVGDGVKTPPGTYTFTSKERDPSWTNPVNGQLLANNHPENILGSRWMAMKGMNTQGLGIHGTTVDDSIPGYTSAGCVRLLNKDVEELFSYARIGGRVTVLD